MYTLQQICEGISTYNCQTDIVTDTKVILYTQHTTACSYHIYLFF